MGTTKRSRLAILALSAMLLLSACGGGKGDNEVAALRQQGIISAQQATDLTNMLKNVRAACRTEAQTLIGQISANPTQFPPAAGALLAKAAGSDANNPSDNTCQQAMTEYRVLAATFQNDAQRAAADASKNSQTQIDNLMNTNKEFKDKVLLSLIKAIGSEGNYISNYQQLLVFGSTYQQRISEAASQFGFSAEAVAQLNGELSRVQGLAALRLAATGQNGGGTSSITNNGSLGINSGSGIGGGNGTGIVLGQGLAGYGATSKNPTKTTNSTILNSTNTGSNKSSGGTLNLGFGTGSRTAVRSADSQLAMMESNDEVLTLKRNAKTFFERHKRPNVTAH